MRVLKGQRSSQLDAAKDRDQHTLPPVTPARCRTTIFLMARYWAYWNSGLAFRASFVAPGRTNFLSTSLNWKHTVRSFVESPAGVVPGEVPGGTISVAPRGIPVGATGGGAPIPSGEVMPSGKGVGGSTDHADLGDSRARAERNDQHCRENQPGDIGCSYVAPASGVNAALVREVHGRVGDQYGSRLCRSCLGWVRPCAKSTRRQVCADTRRIHTEPQRNFSDCSKDLRCPLLALSRN